MLDRADLYGYAEEGNCLVRLLTEKRYVVFAG